MSREKKGNTTNTITSQNHTTFIPPETANRGKRNITETTNSSMKVTFSASPEIMNAIKDLAKQEGLPNNRSAYLCMLITREYQRRFGGRALEDADPLTPVVSAAELNARLQRIERLIQPKTKHE